jgi:drug/metabolite transporter (DMT)-like permease
MKQHTKAYGYLIFALVSWGSLYVASKYVLETVPSFTLLFFRYLIAVALLWLLYRIKLKFPGGKKERIYILLIGLLGYFLAIGLQLLGTHYCTASMASLITSMNPAMIILLAAILLKETITVKKGLAVAVTLVGTIVVIGNLGTGNTALGVMFSFASMVGWSLTSVLVRLACRTVDAVTVTVYGMSIGLVCALPAALIESKLIGFALSDMTLPVILWIVYIGVVCTAGGLLFWNKALERLDAATCSLFYPIQPLTSAVLGVLILGEILTLNFIVGGILIIGGILFAVLTERNK